MSLSPSEQKASDFVTKIGIERAERVLDALSRRFDRRYKKACEDSFAPINREWIRVTPFEAELTHRIKIGLQINDDYFTPAAARARIEARIKARKARMAERRKQKALEA